MKHRLIIVEGLPCSGKSTTAAFISDLFSRNRRVCCVDEGTGEHPADYECHALAPTGLLSEESRIVPLAQYSGELFQRLLPHKIYDGLPWETEQPLMLDKWRQFVSAARADTTYVFNCVLLQNPLCETMMRFDLPQDITRSHIKQIADIIRPMDPLVVYLCSGHIADSVLAAARQRPGWLDAVIAYHTGGAYGRRIGAQGFDGYIRCLQARQLREMDILSSLPLSSLILTDPQLDWQAARSRLLDYFTET